MGRRKALPPDFDGNYTEDMLSERQRNILKFVRTFINHKGYPPAVREIGAAVGLSSSASVHNHLKKLQEYGFIQRDADKPRALELMSESVAPPFTVMFFPKAASAASVSCRVPWSMRV